MNLRLSLICHLAIVSSITAYTATARRGPFRFVPGRGCGATGKVRDLTKMGTRDLEPEDFQSLACSYVPAEAFAVLEAAAAAAAAFDPCYEPKARYGQADSAVVPAVAAPSDCHQACADAPGCTHFTLDLSTSECHLKEGGGAGADLLPAAGFVSGSRLCPCFSDTVDYHDADLGGAGGGYESARDCQLSCAANPDCGYFAYAVAYHADMAGSCWLKAHSAVHNQVGIAPSLGILTGPAVCP